MFINGLPASSLFCYTTLLYLHQYLHAHMPCAFCSSTFYSLCTMSIPCTIPLCVFHLLHTASFYTPKSLSIAALISSLFCILIVFVHLVHAISAMLLHALPMSSALPNHHYNSSSSLVVKPMHPSSLGVMSRFLSLSSS
jgi:hypothetical protein